MGGAVGVSLSTAMILTSPPDGKQRHYAVIHLLGSLSNDDIDPKDDDAKSKMNLYSTHKIHIV